MLKGVVSLGAWPFPLDSWVHPDTVAFHAFEH